ncbi:MAG: hypothetical protein AAGH42_09635 [Pseudomonadota bacterium]
MSSDWTYEQLVQHFSEQTAAHSILVWDCGDGGDNYRIRVVDGFSRVTGFREAVGTIHPSEGRLHLASYTALTMAAQFDDETIPAKNETEASFQLPAVPTRVRVIQLYNPETIDYDTFIGPHFQVEFEPGDGDAWNGVVWNRDTDPDYSKEKGGIVGLITRLFHRRRS